MVSKITQVARGGHKLQCRRGARQVVPWGQWLSYKAARKVGSVQTRNTSCIEGAVVSRLQLKAAGHVGPVVARFFPFLKRIQKLALVCVRVCVCVYEISIPLNSGN